MYSLNSKIIDVDQTTYYSKYNADFSGVATFCSYTAASSQTIKSLLVLMLRVKLLAKTVFHTSPSAGKRTLH